MTVEPARPLNEPRIAFTAQFWGDHAVICRATEGYPGTTVEREFGLFDTWTHAQCFADALNRGLDLDPSVARDIVTASILEAGVINAAARQVTEQS